MGLTYSVNTTRSSLTKGVMTKCVKRDGIWDEIVWYKMVVIEWMNDEDGDDDDDDDDDCGFRWESSIYVIEYVPTFMNVVVCGFHVVTLYDIGIYLLFMYLHYIVYWTCRH